ncbi:hypothetical protein EDB85DRAFT_2070588 [Lactarius pseudohatsudake]|nr:hypothetical protein EDB85DRAFT_2070588 [Lactarius pseudohatsudake]
MPPRRGARQQQKQQKQEPPKAPGLIRDPEVAYKLMEYVLDSPNGKRTLSRLARVSKVLVEPGLGLLWKELDNLVPLISLFPNQLFKRAKRPGLGLAEPPAPEHWEKVVQYGERVRRLTYDEGSKSVSPSIFSIIDEHRPRTYILPNLTTLIWRIETPAGLDHLNLFLNPELQNLTLDIAPRLPQIGDVLADISRRTKLSSLSLTSLVPLPDDLPRHLAPQTDLDRVVLMAPGALSPGLGRWLASLERLRSLQLDLSGRPSKAVDEFFRHVGASGSGFSTPNSARSRDSGVFSSEDIDFTEIKKSMKKSKQRAASFVALRSLQLTGEVPAVLELVIEDPFDKADWRNLCVLLSQSFGESLQSLKISAGGSSRFNDLVRSTTTRAEPVSRRLSLESLTGLPCLTRLDIDLPESVIVQNSDVAQLAEACPNLEILRLCPTARFPVSTGPPSLTLDGLAQLTARCRNLETLAVVMYLHRVLHLGHSWVREPLTAALALSHLAPHADTLRWFHEKNRPGFIETHALGWQRVAEMLPHLQDVRLTERWMAGRAELPEPRHMVDKAIDAKPLMRDNVAQAVPKMTSTAMQVVPQTSDKAVSAWPRARSTAVDATPAVNSQGVDAVPTSVDEGIMVSPVMVSQEIEAVVKTVEESVDATMASEFVDAPIPGISEIMDVPDGEAEMYPPSPPKKAPYIPQIYVPTVVGSAITLAWKTMLFGPNFVTARMQDVWAMTPFHASKTRADMAQLHEEEEEDSDEGSVVSEKVLPVDSGVGLDTDIVPVCI